MLVKFVFGVDGSDLLTHLTQMENRIMTEIQALQDAVAGLKSAVATEADELNAKIAKLENAIAQQSLDRDAIAAITEDIKASSAAISSFVVPDPLEEIPDPLAE